MNRKRCYCIFTYSRKKVGLSQINGLVFVADAFMFMQIVIEVAVNACVADETGKEEIIINGQNFEQAKSGSDQSSGNEKLNINHTGPSNTQDISQSSIL